MRANVYQLTGYVTRSVVRAEQVASVQIDEEPEDEARFADRFGGDFIEIDNSDSDNCTPGDDIHE